MPSVSERPEAPTAIQTALSRRDGLAVLLVTR